MKYYAVKKDSGNAIYTSWDECKSAISGEKGVKYKSFSTLDEAKAYLEDSDIWKETIANDIKKGFVVSFCDGSFDRSLKRYSYGAVIIDLNFNEHFINGYGDNEKYLSSHNVAGEVFGVLNSLDWAKKNGCKKIKIYHDYNGLSKWVMGEWKANSDIAKTLKKEFEDNYKNEMEVVFEKVKGHSNNKYNDKADALAREALKPIKYL